MGRKGTDPLKENGKNNLRDGTAEANDSPKSNFTG
jgi:hypothetical protein